MKRFFVLLLSLALLLGTAACGSSASEDEGLAVYRLLRSEYQTDGTLLRAETLDTELAPTLEDALAALAEPPRSPELESALGNVKVLSWTLQDGEAALELSEEFLALTGMARTLAAYCLTLTLCGVEGVDTVSLYCAGEARALGLTADDVLLYDAQSDPYEKQVSLYFSAGDGLLTEELRSLAADDDMPAERYVMEELLRGPLSEGLAPLLPEGTRLLSISTRDGLCTVNLTAEFLIGDYPDNAARRMAVYSVVNTLTAISGVSAVAFYAAGAPVRGFGALDLSGPIRRNEALTGPVNAARGEAQVALYLLSASENLLLPAAQIVAAGDFDNAADALLDMLSKADEGLLQNPARGVEPLATELRAGVYTIDLPDSFFASRSRSELELAVTAIARSLTSLPEVEAIALLRDGGTALAFGRNYSREFTGDAALILE